MPLDAISAGEVFTVRVYKTVAGYAWANTYEVQAIIEPPNPVTAIENLASSLVSLEQQLHLQSAVIDRVVVSTYVPDGLPYNPSSFTSIPFNVNGQRVETGDVAPFEMCLFVRRNVATGRDGRLLYRACLNETDTVNPIFRPQLTAPAKSFFVTALNTWFTTTFPSTTWNMVMASGLPNPTNIRLVLGLQVADKLVVKKLNNRFYDRLRQP